MKIGDCMAKWKNVELGEVVTLKRGYDLPQQKRVAGTIPIFSSSGINGYHNTAMVKGPGVVTGRYGTIGQVFFADQDFWPLNTTLYVEDFHGNDPEFIYYFLKILDWNSFTSASAVPGINRNTVHKTPVTVPDLGTQQKIAAVLKSLDDRIALNNKINDNLEQQAETLFQNLFIDNARSEWKQGTVCDLGTVVGGSTPSKSKPEYYTDSGIAWITPKDLSVNKSKFIYHGENDITELGLKNSSASIMPEGTVLFSSRAPIGYIAIAAGEVTTNQGFKSIVPKSEIGTAFVYYFLKYNLPVIEGMASGSTFKEVSGATMKKVPAFIPDAETLNKFRRFCEPLFAQQKVLEKQNESLAELRDSLLPKLMAGEITTMEI